VGYYGFFLKDREYRKTLASDEKDAAMYRNVRNFMASATVSHVVRNPNVVKRTVSKMQVTLF
jgi:hypothetical protein